LGTHRGSSRPGKELTKDNDCRVDLRYKGGKKATPFGLQGGQRILNFLTLTTEGVYLGNERGAWRKKQVTVVAGLPGDSKPRKVRAGQAGLFRRPLKRKH